MVLLLDRKQDQDGEASIGSLWADPFAVEQKGGELPVAATATNPECQSKLACATGEARNQNPSYS